MDSFLLITLSLVAASTIQALTGFGFSLFLLPVLMLFYSSHEAVILSLALTFISHTLMLGFIYRHVNFRAVSLMFLMCIPGIYAGSILFGLVNALWLRYLVSAMTILFSLFLLFQPARPPLQEKAGAILAGFLSGLFSALLSTPGPPIVLFAVDQKYRKEVFRASLGAFFLAVTPISLLVHTYANSSFTLPLITKSFAMIPPIILGNALGLWLFPHIPPQHIRNMALLMLLCLGMITFLVN